MTESEKLAHSVAKKLNGLVDLPDIDLETLREKYRVERDRRVRSDGEDQYVEVSGKYARYGQDDPYAPERLEREPLSRDVEVLVIGGGWGGLASGVRLHQAGIDDFLIIDGAGDFGGVWYWNRYPGCQCDVDAYVYMPFLEETNYIPTSKYAFAPEIHEHAQRIARTFNLYARALLQTQILEVRWDDETGQWRVATDRGDVIRARFIISAAGLSNRPKLPGIPGLDDFEGKMFHTARWDYEYTGGDNKGNLDKLGDKDVAFIGTGGTGIQVVSHLGEAARNLYVFQRTPSTIGPRLNRPTDPEWVKSLKPGWQARRQRNFDELWAGMDFPDEVDDAFTSIFKDLSSCLPREGLENLTPEEIGYLMELSDARAMNAKRAYVDSVVKNPAVAEKLKPWYRLMCKRPTFNDDYLATFNRPNVTLVDTSDTQGVQRLTRHGVVANNQEYKVDCIVFATGFEISTSFRRRLGFPIIGRGGECLHEYWENGPRTFHGWGVHGFPNLFYLGNVQTGFSPNYTASAVNQATHIAWVINQVRAKGFTRVEPYAKAQEDWVAECESVSLHQEQFLMDCTPGYYNNEGHGEGKNNSPVVTTYGAGPIAFETRMEDWRKSGTLEGLELS